MLTEKALLTVGRLGCCRRKPAAATTVMAIKSKFDECAYADTFFADNVHDDVVKTTSIAIMHTTDAAALCDTDKRSVQHKPQPKHALTEFGLQLYSHIYT